MHSSLKSSAMSGDRRQGWTVESLKDFDAEGYEFKEEVVVLFFFCLHVKSIHTVVPLSASIIAITENLWGRISSGCICL